jgi:hypothetical protein
MLYRADNRIQDCSTKNRRVFGLGSSFGDPQLSYLVAFAFANVSALPVTFPSVPVLTNLSANRESNPRY